MSPVACLFCGRDNPLDAKFCNRCGTSLQSKPCLACGAAVDRQTASCARCDRALSPRRIPKLEAGLWSDVRSDLCEVVGAVPADDPVTGKARLRSVDATLDPTNKQAGQQQATPQQQDRRPARLSTVAAESDLLYAPDPEVERDPIFRLALAGVLLLCAGMLVFSSYFSPVASEGVHKTATQIAREAPSDSMSVAPSATVGDAVTELPEAQSTPYAQSARSDASAETAPASSAAAHVATVPAALNGQPSERGAATAESVELDGPVAQTDASADTAAKETTSGVDAARAGRARRIESEPAGPAPARSAAAATRAPAASALKAHAGKDAMPAEPATRPCTEAVAALGLC